MIFRLVVLILLIAPGVQATTYFVRNGGSSTTNCTGTTNADYDGSGTGEACAYSNLQDAIDASTWGDTIKLHAGQSFRPPSDVDAFHLTAKGTPPTGTDADYITITTDDTSGTPSALSNYPATVGRPTTASAANMPKILADSQYGYPALWINKSAKYWTVERIEFTNDSDRSFQTVRLIDNSSESITSSEIAAFPDRLRFRLNWFHPREETGAVMDNSNKDRSVENAIYINGTNITIEQNAFTGFFGLTKYGGEAGANITSSNVLIGSYGDTIQIQNNLFESFTYSIFTGGSGFIPRTDRSGTVSNCTSNSCDFSSTAGLSVGDPVSIYVSTASPAVWGWAVVTSITGSTVGYTTALQHSYDNNSPSFITGAAIPDDGDAAQWDGYQVEDVTIYRNIFNKPLEMMDFQNGGQCSGKGYAEIKACKNCTVNANWFRGCSTALTITVRNQSGDGVWATLDGLTISNNFFEHGMSMLSGVFVDGANYTNKSQNITYTNNFTWKGDRMNPSASAWLAQNFQGGVNVTMTHNTDLTPSYRNFVTFGSYVGRTVGEDYSVSENPIFRDNIVQFSPNSCFYNSGGGETAVNSLLPCWDSPTVTNNVFVDDAGWVGEINASWLTDFPSNDSEADRDDVGFTDLTNGKPWLLDTSAYYHAASDGSDVGVNIPAIIAAAGVDWFGYYGDRPSTRIHRKKAYKGYILHCVAIISLFGLVGWLHTVWKLRVRESVAVIKPAGPYRTVIGRRGRRQLEEHESVPVSKFRLRELLRRKKNES